MKKNIAYWLLARFPRPVAVLYAILVQAIIDNVDKLIVTIWFMGIAISFVVFGMAVAVGCTIVPLTLLFIGIAIEELSKIYEKFDEALPKREKKDKEG